jgi:hypothetical protein
MSSIGILLYSIGFILAGVLALVAFKKQWKISDYF